MFALLALIVAILGLFGVAGNWFMLFLTLAAVALHLLLGWWPVAGNPSWHRTP